MNRKLWLGLTISISWFLLAASAAAAPVPVVAAVPPGGQAAPPPAAGAPPADPQADTPYTLVDSGVTSYTIADPKIFWYSLPPCINPPPPAPTTNVYETINRIPTYAGTNRKLFKHQVNTNCPSNPDVQSNIVDYGNNLYWMSTLDGGLVKLSVDANVGDKPTVVDQVFNAPAQMVHTQGSLFILAQVGAAGLEQVNLSTGAVAILTFAGTGSTDLQADNTYLYWIKGGTLHQWDIATAKEKSTIASGVTGYYPTGATVYYAKGKDIYRFGNTSRTADLIYTSTDSSAGVYNLKYDNTNLFWFEDRPQTCGGCLFPPQDDLLFRSGPGGGSPTNIYVYHANIGPQASDLKGAGDYLFWLENGALQRFPKDAAALPKINLVVDSLEVTQGIQYKTCVCVGLIQNRDTYVRFYVHSAGAAVPGVAAFLYRTNSGGTVIDGPLNPVNPAGELLTVLPSPRRNNLNDSYLFELPWNWINGGTLYLKAVLNPGQDPLEPNYADNTLGPLPLIFQPSPRLQMILIEWGYYIKGSLYWPSAADENLTLSWVRRTYPLASAAGSYEDPSPGFRPELEYIIDDGLGSRVNRTASECSDNLCASAYSNNLMSAMRGTVNIPDNIFMYGMISDAAGFFPRGQACCGTNVSTGPAGSNSYGWDFDGSYADWYAGHEIGHTLGRQHPATSGSPICDSQSADDGSYPYPHADIGPNGGALEGFDVGDGSQGLPLRIYPGTTWHDVMSYCNNQWISDYTYNGMYSYMIANPLAPAGQVAPQATAITGNWLAVYGEVITGTNSAILAQVRHVSTIASIPPRVAGPYSIELRDAGNSLLASYPFTPLPATDDAPNWLNFTQVVTYVANTAQLRVVRLSDSHVLATKAVPPHAPTVGSVALVGAPNPVAGTVTLNWTAGDVDGNPLTFDIFYSRDGGATVRPVAVGVSGNSTLFDTTHLGGSGTALLRVVASDGVNTAQADSASFTMANKPPRPMILTPADGTQRHYGQLVNFSGEATDAQDGSVDPSKLVWSDQAGSLGTGALLSVSDLPVGTDVITLKATDSAGKSASTSITVIVDDNLDLPGPTLSVGPQQFGWSFTSSAAASQTDLLTLDNVGGGTLTWTATTDAPWLKLSIASGTAPSQITLTADPSGIQNGTALSGHVFINVPAGGGSPAQQVVVPVGLGVGIDFASPPKSPLQVFLPLVAR